MNRRGGTIIELGTVIVAVVACCVISYSLLVSRVGGAYQAAAKQISINENIPQAMKYRALSGIPLPLERVLGEQDTDLMEFGRRTDDRVYYPGRTVGTTSRSTRISETAQKEGRNHSSSKYIQRETQVEEDTLPLG